MLLSVRMPYYHRVGLLIVVPKENCSHAPEKKLFSGLILVCTVLNCESIAINMS